MQSLLNMLLSTFLQFIICYLRHYSTNSLDGSNCVSNVAQLESDQIIL